MRSCACDTASRLCVRTVVCRSTFSWPRPFVPQAPQQLMPPRLLASSLLWTSPTSPLHSSSATAPRLPNDAPITADRDSDGDLPVPVQETCVHARVFDDAGLAHVSRKRCAPCGLLLVRRTSAARTCLTPWRPRPRAQLYGRCPYGQRLTALIHEHIGRLERGEVIFVRSTADWGSTRGLLTTI
jgi:hypothetical protein